MTSNKVENMWMHALKEGLVLSLKETIHKGFVGALFYFSSSEVLLITHNSSAL